MEVKQTKVNKENFYSPIKDYLKKTRTRNEIADYMNTSDREARREVSLVSKFFPVIRGSFTKGYRLARPINELSFEEMKKEQGLVKKTIKDLNAKIKDLKKNLKPLIAYKVVIEKFIEEKEKEGERGIQ